MNVFDLDPKGQAAIDEQARLNPIDASQVAPEWDTGIGYGSGMGVMRGGARTAQALGMAGSFPLVLTDKVFGTNHADEYFADLDATVNNAVDYWTPKPEEVGTAGRVLGGVAEMTLPLMLGAGNPVPLIASQQMGVSFDLAKDGVDPYLSAGAGTIMGAGLAVGYQLPNAIGSNLFTKMASGGGINLAQGVGTDFAVQKTLDAAGYAQQSERFAWDNPEARGVDLLMGMVFGGIANTNKSGRDATLTANNAKHLQHDTMPGNPVDPVAVAEHTKAIETAIRQLQNGEPVNVQQTITEATFARKPQADAMPIERMDVNARRLLPYNAPELDAYASAIEQKYDLPAGLLVSIKNAGEKSGSNAVSPKGARGVMQFMGKTAKQYGLADPTDPIASIDAAGRYFADLMKRYDGDIKAAITEYNGGVKQAKAVKAGGQPTANETRMYLSRVTVAMREHQLKNANLTDESKTKLRQLYQEAEERKPRFDSELERIANEVGGSVKTADLKGVERATKKIVSDYNGDAGQIKDLLRATIEVEEQVGAQAAFDRVVAQYEVVGRPRNLFDPAIQPADGYRDAKINVLIDGHVAEIQINLPEMMAAKKIAHPLYEKAEEIRRVAQNENRQRTAAEDAEIARLNEEMRAIYEPAWTAATIRANSSAGIGEPFLRADSNENLRGGKTSQAAQYKAPASGSFSDTGIPSTSKNSALGESAAANTAGSLNAAASSGAFISDPSSDILANSIPGRKTSAFTERGNKVNLRYTVVDMQQLKTSHSDDLTINKDYPAELQPRDRTRAASEAQITKIENAINPELLAESPKASDGAPIVGRDGVVESGNARTIAMRRAYGSGKAEGYRAWLQENAGRFGIDPQQIAGMQQPMLVRVGEGDYNRAEFARQANESSVALMSVTEQANTDAARMPDLIGLVAREDGSIDTRASGPFIRAFMDRVVSPNEQGLMITADGGLSQLGLMRIRNALFAKAYGDAEIVALMAESTDANIKNVLAGMTRAAPAMARLKELIAAGTRYPMDVSADLAQAVRKFSQLRQDGMTVEQYLGQQSLFESGITPEVNNLLIGLQENAKAPKRVAEMIGRYVDAVDRLGDPRQGSMFEDAQPVRPNDLVADAIQSVREDFELPQAGDLFKQVPEMEIARAVLEDNPDLRVVMDDGTEVSAREALAQAEAEAAQANTEAGAFGAAINCFLRAGA